jgi:uncharacterized protein (TIGR00730 family)
MTKRVCIFCAASDKIPQVFFNETERLTRLLVDNRFGIVYGGGSIGLMGQVAKTTLELNGDIIGVIPQFMMDVEWGNPDVTDMRITETMAERKRLLIDLADAIIVLPGSTGTMDELFDALSDKKLGLLWKPIVILNTNGFYNGLKNQLQTMVDYKFMTHKHLSAVTFVDTPEDALQRCINGDDINLKTSLDEAVV